MEAMEAATEVEPLPAWAYDLITAVQEHEDTHRGVRDDGTCLAAALNRVPERFRRDAAVIAAYNADEVLSAPLR